MSGHRRPRPDRLERLPQQYFAALLARVAAASRDGGPPVIDLGRGNPEVGPPAHVVEALRTSALRDDVHGYSPFRGLPELRAAIALRYRTHYGVELDPDTEVAVVPATKTAIVELALALAQRGDTILLPDPGYPDYLSGVALAGAELGLLPLDPAAGWAPDLAPAPAAAAAYLNYPSNPCAVAAPPGLFEAAVAYAERTGTAIVHDAAYIDIVFDGRDPKSYLATPGAKESGVELWTMSKTFGMAGWRIGFVVGNAELVERVNLLNDTRGSASSGRSRTRRSPRSTGRRTRSRSAAPRTSGAATARSRRCPGRSPARARSTSGSGSRPG
jgi:aminotransferase